MSVVFGGVDIKILEADEAGEVSGALAAETGGEKTTNQMLRQNHEQNLHRWGSFPASPFQPAHQLTRSTDPPPPTPLTHCWC